MTDDEAAMAVVEMLHRLLSEEERHKAFRSESATQLGSNLSGPVQASSAMTGRFQDMNKSQSRRLDVTAPLLEAAFAREESYRQQIIDAYASRERAYARLVNSLEIR